MSAAHVVTLSFRGFIDSITTIPSPGYRRLTGTPRRWPATGSTRSAPATLPPTQGPPWHQDRRAGCRPPVDPEYPCLLPIASVMPKHRIRCPSRRAGRRSRSLPGRIALRHRGRAREPVRPARQVAAADRLLPRAPASRPCSPAPRFEASRSSSRKHRQGVVAALEGGTSRDTPGATREG
jgi:hypothetical protein